MNHFDKRLNLKSPTNINRVVAVVGFSRAKMLSKKRKTNKVALNY